MPRVLHGREDSSFAAMFCVYAAETFRRRHAGGPWKWEIVFAEIEQATPEYQSIYAWVEKGLQHFDRELLKSCNGDREFLLTLACEGGLPLRLLHKENAHLSRYFRELLTAYHREHRLPGCDATDIARQIAARFLPASLRRDVVFRLSGDLIQSIVHLQAQVADATNPITSLDRVQPKWREQLPLPVEDATVEALLRNLVGQARALALTERQCWRWRCILVRRGEQWSIEQHLELPSTVTGVSVQDWSGWDNPPVRLRVLLHTPEGIEPIALLTRLQGVGDQATYRCEGLRRGGVRLLGNAATAGVRLLLSNGNTDAAETVTPCWAWRVRARVAHLQRVRQPARGLGERGAPGHQRLRPGDRHAGAPPWGHELSLGMAQDHPGPRPIGPDEAGEAGARTAQAGRHRRWATPGGPE